MKLLSDNTPLRRLVKKIANAVPRPATIVDYVGYRLQHSQRLSRYRLDDAELIGRIREHGFTLIENYFTADECAECIRDIEWMLENKKQHILRYSDRRIFGAEELSASVARFSADLHLNDVSNAYNCVKTVNAFTLANKVEGSAGNTGSGEGWHKDSSFRQFKAILYLNDVHENNGPFQVIHKSHTLPAYLGDMRVGGVPFRQLRITDTQMEQILAADPMRLRTVTAPRGTLILVDTASIHRGRPAREGVRYALTNYYVEKFQITPEYVSAFSPVAPDKVLRLRETWTD